MPNALSLLTAAAIGFGCTAFIAEPETVAPIFVIEAITQAGDVFIAGSGDTCRAAWQNVVMPAEPVQIVCRSVAD